MAMLQLLTNNLKKLKIFVKSKWFKIFVFALVFVFTFILRAHNYERTPTSNHLDEQLYALSGIYLVETGTPVSWSTLNYPKSAEVFSGLLTYKGGQPSAYVTLFRPWLDEPPLFSLLVGESAHIFHVDRTGWIPSSYIRFPIVIISAFTSILIFLIAMEVSGFWTGILTMLIYGTEPIMVFASRTAMPETLIAFFFCLMIYLLLKFMKNKSFWYIVPIPVFAGLSGLSKPTGYFILGLAIYVVFSEFYKLKPIKWDKVVKYLLYLVLATVPFVLIYIWYGNHFNSEIFKSIVLTQGFRPAGFNSLAWFFITPSADTTILRSAWYVFCLVSAAFFIFQPKEKVKQLISLSFIYWVVVVMLSGGENDLLSWYRFPAFPFLAILGAWGVEYIYEKADFFASFFGVGFLLGSRMLLVNAFRPNVSADTFRFSFSMLLAPSLLNTIFNRRWLKFLSRIVIVGVVVVGMWWNVKYIYNAYELDCESQTCPMVPSTILSSLHYPVIWRFFVLGDSVLH
jgi:4-amino-4-deoxy-L-arabinose transferase-like glycosyltransferase